MTVQHVHVVDGGSTLVADYAAFHSAALVAAAMKLSECPAPLKQRLENGNVASSASEGVVSKTANAPYSPAATAACGARQNALTGRNSLSPDGPIQKARARTLGRCCSRTTRTTAGSSTRAESAPECPRRREGA
jgi:hypothetical protein